MRRALIAFAACLASVAAAEAGEAAEPKPAIVEASAPATAEAADATAPYLAVRSLGLLQEQIARGNVAAQAAMPALLAHLAEVFRAAGPAAFKDRRNDEAAALYLLSAGRPSAIRDLLAGATLAHEDEDLVQGALAYASGDDETARTRLARLDPRQMPRAIGGHLALVLATLLIDKDPRRAQAMLDEARLLVPGTLVEEAALRRQIFLLAQPATVDRFVTLSRQYLHRFRASVFAGNFRARLLSFATALALTGDLGRFTKLGPVFADLAPADAKSIYLSLARASLLANQPDVTRYAVARAMDLSPSTSESLQARLYAAAADAPSQSADAAHAALLKINPDGLTPADASLRDAALAIAASVLAETPAAVTGGATPADAPAAATLDRGRTALANADSLLSRAP